MKDKPKGDAYYSRYGMDRDPFPDTVDDIYFLTPTLQQRLQLIRHLLLSSRQLILITGENGAGTSALCRYLASRTNEPWWIQEITAAPSSDQRKLLSTILSFPLLEENSTDEHEHLLNRLKQLQNQELQPLIILDNAHLLAEPQLHLLLRLSQISHENQRYRIILAGQKHLQKRLLRVVGDDIAHGIIHVVQLDPLAFSQVSAYIAHRLASCGASGDLFDHRQYNDIAVVSGGLPGRINSLARQALQSPKNLTLPHSARGVSLGSASGFWVRTVAFGIVAVVIMTVVLTFSQREKTPAQAVRLDYSMPVPSPPGQSMEESNSVHEVTRVIVQDELMDSNTPDLPTAIEQELKQAVKKAPIEVAGRDPDPLAGRETDIEESKTIKSFSGDNPVQAVRQNSPPTSEALPGFPSVLGRDWLERLPAESYVIQLIGAHELQTIRRFLGYKPALPGENALVVTSKDNRAWYLLLTGPYEDRVAAVAGITGLPDYARRIRPWPRSSAAIKAEINGTTSDT